MDLHQPVDQNCAHLRVDVVLPAHVVRVHRAHRLSGEAVLVDVGCMLRDVLRVEEHGLINWIYLTLEKVSLLEFGVEVGQPLLHAQVLSLVAEVVVQGAHGGWFLHAAVVCGALGVVLAARHLGVRLLRRRHGQHRRRLLQL